jgi:hypothetical protein
LKSNGLDYIKKYKIDGKYVDFAVKIYDYYIPIEVKSREVLTKNAVDLIVRDVEKYKVPKDNKIGVVFIVCENIEGFYGGEYSEKGLVFVSKGNLISSLVCFKAVMTCCGFMFKNAGSIQNLVNKYREYIYVYIKNLEGVEKALNLHKGAVKGMAEGYE